MRSASRDAVVSFVALSALTIAGAGCGSPDRGPQDTGAGGYVELTMLSLPGATGVGAAQPGEPRLPDGGATFFSRSSGTSRNPSLFASPAELPAFGECVDGDATYSPAWEFTTGELQLNNFTLQTGTGSVEMASQGGYFRSSGYTGIPSIGDYDVLLGSETWSHALTIPPAIAITSPSGFATGDVTVPAGQPLVFHWRPTGSSGVLFEIGNDLGTAVELCRSRDVGSFEIPIAVPNIPSTGHITVTNYLTRPYLNHGRRVDLIGIQQVSVTFHRH